MIHTFHSQATAVTLQHGAVTGHDRHMTVRCDHSRLFRVLFRCLFAESGRNDAESGDLPIHNRQVSFSGLWNQRITMDAAASLQASARNRAISFGSNPLVASAINSASSLSSP
jgi:hypothetical protein